jgi:competence ComEA-like helix-hairpin-helix protein
MSARVQRFAGTAGRTVAAGRGRNTACSIYVNWLREKTIVDINTATAQELERVGQIDGARAQYLVDYRERQGRFSTWEQVKQVPSYEDGMIERLQKAGFTVGGAGATGRHSDGRKARASGAASGGSGQGGRSSGEERGGCSLNRASAEELEQTHMIDGERAQRIVAYRNEHGEFRDWQEVKEVLGIDDGIVRRLQEAGFDIR